MSLAAVEVAEVVVFPLLGPRALRRDGGVAEVAMGWGWLVGVDLAVGFRYTTYT